MNLVRSVINKGQDLFLLGKGERLLYIISDERGVCFRTALGESLCGSLFACQNGMSGKER